ncbi:hypothetical protein POTOM_055283 [Populus tomentosa]|uniref:non-specific serine/threonine protein kinase n=1 Tax=Populus tomentosa TaxID=118781 RepID=A0A8X7Y089_POPTO|nr:hypothetical protein POTOM_055283 [Populus tomentosa]
MQHHLFPTMSWFIIFLIITFVHAPSSAFANDDERYVNCSNSFDCGDIKGVGYPFWGSNRPEYCGYPELKLNCSDQDLEITIEKLTYKVLGIDNQSRILSVARKDYAENICPTLILNTTWIPNLLNYTSDDQNITIYYGCPTQGAPSALPLVPQFPCNINATEMTGYFTAVPSLSDLGSSASNLISYLATCSDSIKVPVRESALQQFFSAPNVTQLLEGLNQGFGLEWNAFNSLCDTCQLSGGQCGYNQTTTAFTCYCKDQPRQFSCQESPTEAQSPTNDQSSIKETMHEKDEILLHPITLGIGSTRRRRLWIALGTSAAVAAMMTFSIITIYLTRREGSFGAVIAMTFRLKKSQHVGRVKTFMMDYHSLTPKRYSYSDIKKMTNSFFYTLGQGGFGNVYRGKLPDDGRLVAVKVLKESKGDGEEFMNEVASISRTSHVNISDFGLAKLCKSKVSKISMIGARGTVGYIAPEVFCRNFGGVTYKSDVYSYGMMVLEMVGQSKDFDMGSVETNELYFPDWFYMYLDPGEISTFHGDTLEEEKEIVKKMILVGLWCIQTMPSHRPSMTKVVEMFEGSLQSLQIPPRPSLSSPRRSAQDHSSNVSSLPCVSSQGGGVNTLSADESDL